MASEGRLRSLFYRFSASTRLVLVGLGAVGLFMIVAAASGAYRSAGFATSAASDDLWILEVLFTAGAVLAAVCGILALLVMLWLRFAGPTDQPRRWQWWWRFWLSWAAFVAFAAWLPPLRDATSDPVRVPERAQQSGAVPAGEAGSGPTVHWWLVGLVFGLTCLLAGIAWWRTTRQRDAVRPETPLGVVAGAAGESLDAVLAEPDPRRAVVMAYQRMEHLLGLAGVPRKSWEAPFEYLDRVFAEFGASAAVASTLTDLYERARFGHHPITIEARDAAVIALLELVDELPELA